LKELSGDRRRQIVKYTPQCTLTTDASEIGFGAELTFHDDGQVYVMSGNWNYRMTFQSSNIRELTAIFMAVNTFREKIRGKCVLIRTDNVTSRAYVLHQGGPLKHLNWISRAVWSLAAQYDIKLQVVFIKGARNVQADHLSRILDQYNYRLNPVIFHQLNRLLGPFTIDRFADMNNHQLEVYNSLWQDPMNVGVDCFVQSDWNQHHNYCLPPFHLINRLLDVIQEYKALATLILPWWPAQVWMARVRRWR
jgi:hypothetical protein